MNRWIFGVAAMLLIGWAGLWVISSWTFKRDIESWFDARRADGWQADYADLTVRGFPSRLDATLTGVRLHDPARDLGWQAPFFQILGLTYRPGHLILVWPETQALTLPSGSVTIDANGLRASVIHGADGHILRANFEADTVGIDGPQRVVQFNDLRAAVTDVAAAPNLYRVGVASKELQLQAEVTFDQDWALSALVDPLPQLQKINLRLAEYSVGDASLSLTGQLSSGPQGRANGQLVLHAVEWRDLLTDAADLGLIPETLADTVNDNLANHPDTLDLPLRFEQGRVFLDQILIGDAPLMHLP